MRIGRQQTSGVAEKCVHQEGTAVATESAANPYRALRWLQEEQPSMLLICLRAQPSEVDTELQHASDDHRCFLAVPIAVAELQGLGREVILQPAFGAEFDDVHEEPQQEFVRRCLPYVEQLFEKMEREVLESHRWRSGVVQ
jgi:hypothetical protein